MPNPKGCIICNMELFCKLHLILSWLLLIEAEMIYSREKVFAGSTYHHHTSYKSEVVLLK